MPSSPRLLPAMRNFRLAWLLACVLGCGGDGSAQHAPSIDATVAKKRVFLTQAEYQADFGDLAGADALCNASAAGAGLGSTWMAWLSNGTVSAIDRISDVGPWYAVDGATLVFNNKANLATTPANPISLNEHGGATPAGHFVWTGTRLGGTKASDHCRGWSTTDVSAVMGEVAVTSNAWTESLRYGQCFTMHHLLCIEQ